MLACSLDANKFNISIYEKNTALCRKFLVAGKGGFNLTHSEELPQFSDRYYPQKFMLPFLEHFSNSDFRNWLKEIGVETYVGTSKRVFPIKGIKPIEVLKQIEKQLEENNVSVFYDHTWQGWKNKELMFSHNSSLKNIKTDITVFALGGASWKVTGSSGDWGKYFNEKKIEVQPFYPSNCSYKVDWPDVFIKSNHGQALKNCEFSCGQITRKGEAVITKFGIEGSGIYPLSPEIRKQLIVNGSAEITIDFKPDLLLGDIKDRLNNKGRSSIKDVLEKKINLSSIQTELLKIASSKEEYNDINILSQLIKSYPLTIVDFAPIDEAISTVGGISLDEVNDNLELNKLPGHYCIGEMLDWDAPTGGYLLQACFSMGKFLASRLNAKQVS